MKFTSVLFRVCRNVILALFGKKNIERIFCAKTSFRESQSIFNG